MALNKSTLQCWLYFGKSGIMGNIIHYVNTDKNLKTLKKGIHASDTDQLLNTSGPFTIFAPSDLAFQKLQKGLMDSLLEPQNRPRLAQLVKNHIVMGNIHLKDLKDGDTLTTVNGKELSIQIKDGHVSVDNAAIQLLNARTINGIVHVVDSVLLNEKD